MNKLPSMSTREVINTLQKGGFTVVRQRDHIRLKNGTRALSVSHYQQTIPYGTLRIILRQAGLTVDQFAQLLKAK